MNGFSPHRPASLDKVGSSVRRWREYQSSKNRRALSRVIFVVMETIWLRTTVCSLACQPVVRPPCPNKGRFMKSARRIALTLTIGIFLMVLGFAIIGLSVFSTIDIPKRHQSLPTQLATVEIPHGTELRASRGDFHIRGAVSTSTSTTVAPTTTTTVVRTTTTKPPPKTTTTVVPDVDNGSNVAVDEGGIPRLLRRIGGCESSGRANGPLVWTAKNRYSTASGAWQYLKTTWNGYKGYSEARYAPPEVQIERAVSDFNHFGTGAWNSSRACWA